MPSTTIASLVGIELKQQIDRQQSRHHAIEIMAGIPARRHGLGQRRVKTEDRQTQRQQQDRSFEARHLHDCHSLTVIHFRIHGLTTRTSRMRNKPCTELITLLTA
jgi:hypothetical protein